MRRGVVILLGVVGLLTAVTPTRGQTGGAPGPELPRVVLVGDSIRLGYAARVAERLAGKAVVISPPENGGDSANVLAHLDEWVLRQKPDVVHLNCGLHDLKRSKADGHHQVELDRYAENLRRIVARIREGTDAALVFADTTPILDERHAKRGADFDRTEADVRKYNAAAIAIMGELGVPVHDLHWVVEQGESGDDARARRDPLHGRRLRSARRGGCRLRASPGDGPPLSALAAAGLRARGRRGVPRGRRPPRCAGPRGLPAAQGRRVPHPGGRRRLEGAAADGPPDRRRFARRPAAPALTLASPDHLPRAPPGLHARKSRPQQRRGRRGDGAAARPGGPEGAGAGHPLAPLLDPRQDAGDHPRDQRRRGVARGRPSCGRAMRCSHPTPTGTATAPAPGRRARRSRAGPSRRTCSSSTCGSAAPSGACSSGTTRSRSTTSAAARRWTPPASAPPA